jgi:copper chaperone NosL
MMRAISLRAVVVSALVFSSGCVARPPEPVPFDAAAQPCQQCRMVGSDGRFAAEIVAPGEEPLFFDDIGCMSRYLTQSAVSAGAAAYVADHRTRAWVPAARAVYSRRESVRTPMNTHLMAHESIASRDADPAAANAAPASLADVFPSGSVPEVR